MRDLFASLLKDEVDPHLQPLTGKVLIASANSSDEARLDVSARGFWQRGQPAFFDVRIFNPFAKSQVTLTKNLTRLSRAMRTRKSHITTSELSKSSIVPSALLCSHHMVETVEKPSDFLPN